jgi:anti-sigma B factor antagonist
VIEQPPPAEVGPLTSDPNRSEDTALIEVALSRHMTDNATAAVAELSVQLDRADRRIAVRGELDLATVPVLVRTMATLRELDPGDSTIDLSGLTFIDAAGVGCLVDHAAQVTALGAKISMVGATSRVRRVFDIVGLVELLQAA